MNPEFRDTDDQASLSPNSEPSVRSSPNERSLITRAYLERQCNWQATFEWTRADAREPFDCLMQTVRGGFYWHTPDYKGLFPYGATREYRAESLADALRREYVRIVRGKVPLEVRAMVPDRERSL